MFSLPQDRHDRVVGGFDATIVRYLAEKAPLLVKNFQRLGLLVIDGQAVLDGLGGVVLALTSA